MLYPELNGLIGLFPEYKRLILPKIRAAVKVYSVRSEIFSGRFFVFGRKKGRRLQSKRRPQLVKKPRRVSPLGGEIEFYPFFLPTCAGEKTLLSPQMCEMCAIGAH